VVHIADIWFFWLHKNPFLGVFIPLFFLFFWQKKAKKADFDFFPLLAFKNNNPPAGHFWKVKNVFIGAPAQKPVLLLKKKNLFAATGCPHLQWLDQLRFFRNVKCF
jgi:hypothetical protein